MFNFGHAHKEKLKGLWQVFVYSISLASIINLFLQFIAFPRDVLFYLYLFSDESAAELFGGNKFFINTVGYVTNSLLMFVPIFMYGSKKHTRYLKDRKEGKLLRGVKRIEDKEEFNKALYVQAKESCRELEEGLGKPLPNFYTPRIHLDSGVPIFLDMETKGFIAIGGAGSGKTNAFWDFYEKVLEWEKMTGKNYFWIVYDRKHDFWKKLYRTYSFKLKHNEIKDFDFTPYDNGFANVKIEMFEKTETGVNLISSKEKMSIIQAKNYILLNGRENYFYKMKIDKDGLFYPKDMKSIRWNWFDEFLLITLVVKIGDEIIKKIPCNTIREAKRIFTEKDIEGFDKNIHKIEIHKTVNSGLFSNLLFALKPKKDEELSEDWNAKGRTGFEAKTITVAFTYDFPSPKDFIDFSNKYDTREKLVAKILEEGYAASQRGISITSAIGNIEKPTEGAVNSYEQMMRTIQLLKKPAYYYGAEDCDFSVRTTTPYMKNSYFDYRLFMVQDPENETEYSLVFAAIYELYSQSIIQLPNDLNRRIFLMLDEAPSLGKMPSVLIDLPQQARSKGASLFIGIQTLVSWASILGEKAIDDILANIKSRLYLNIADNFTMDWVQKNIGQNEYEFEGESLNEKNEGSMSTRVEKRDVITNSELSGLNVSTGFFRQGNFIRKISFPIPSIQDIAEFEPNTSLLDVIPVEFDAELESEHFIKRAKVSEAITFIQNNTNKNLTPESIVFYSKIDLPTVQKIIKEFTEEKDQIERAVLELMKQGIYGDSPKPVYIKALKNKTGLKHIEEVFITKTFLKSKAPKKQEPKIEEPKPKIEELKKEPEVPKKAPESPFDEDDFEPEELSADDLDSLLKGM